MQIVIEISDTLMEYIVKGKDLSEEQNDEMALVIVNGTPLPKGHGDLKDVSKIDYQRGCFVSSEEEPIPIIHKIATIEMIRDWLPTIIEADTEGSESE